ncbi:hypothetical protein NMY22_g14780 [Coprinellus aureogranulatus]|nr:hypothetical protein NMY22_g14780 [Coprinellus aureogranulatus]
MAKRREPRVGPDHYLPVRRGTPSPTSSPAHSHFNSDNDDSDDTPHMAYNSPRRSTTGRRNTVASASGRPLRSESSESETEDKGAHPVVASGMTLQGSSPTRDNFLASAAAKTSSESTSRRRCPRGGSASNSDGLIGEREHIPRGYHSPPSRQSSRALLSAGTSAQTLAEPPSRPPGLDRRRLDEDVDMKASPSSERPIRQMDWAIDDRRRGEREGMQSSPETGDAGNDQVAKGAHQKMTVTMKSPTVADFREYPPMPKDFSPIYQTHTRNDSEPSSGGLRSGYSTPGGSDGEPSDDDYDWSGEEDLAEQQAKFADRMGGRKKDEGWGIKRVIKFLFTTLIGSTLLSCIIVTPPLIVHFVWFKANPNDHRRYVDKNVQAWMFWVAANVTISWFLALIVDVVPIFIQYFLVATWGHVSEAVKSRLEMYNSVKDTGKPAIYAASGIASWVIIFDHIYHLHTLDDEVTSAAAYTDRVYQVLLFFFFLVLIICIQKLLSHVIAWNFHQTAYKDRIEEVQKSLVVIEKLQQYRPKNYKRAHGAQTPMTTGYTFGNGMSEKEHARKLNNALRSALKNPSRLATPSAPDGDHDDYLSEAELPHILCSQSRAIQTRNSGRRVEGSICDSEEFTAATRDEERAHSPHRLSFQPNQSQPQHRYTTSAVSYPDSMRGNGQPQRPPLPRRQTDGEAAIRNAAKAIGKAVLHDARNLQGKQEVLLSWDVSSSQEAKRLARSIFRRLRDKHRKYLLPSDFYPAFPTRQEAEQAFNLFDKDGNGDLSRGEIKAKLVKTYQERRFLSRSLKDVGEALKTLDRILLIFACIIVAFISLSVFGVEVGNSLTSMYSLVIAASFVFKSSASRAFDAIMFLFVTHPYDTGDRVFIGLENLVVKKVGLFATVFQRADGTETYYFNSQLFNVFITNARRSDPTTENMTMEVGWKTPLEKLDALEKCINDWLSTEENRWYRPGTGVTLQHIVYQRYLTLTIGIPHNANWQDWAMRNARRTAFQAAVQYYCRQLGITGYEAPLPIVFQNADPSQIADSPALAKDGEDDIEVVNSPPSSPLNTPGEYHPPDDRSPMEGAVKPSTSPMLGFRPPEGVRHLARARKSHRSRKERLGAANAELVEQTMKTAQRGPSIGIVQASLKRNRLGSSSGCQWQCYRHPDAARSPALERSATPTLLLATGSHYRVLPVSAYPKRQTPKSLLSTLVELRGIKFRRSEVVLQLRSRFSSFHGGLLSPIHWLSRDSWKMEAT